MGQGTSHMQTDEKLRPGTYRIVSGLTSTAIQVSDHDHAKVVAWERHEGEHQQWFLQRSGDGYSFKNRRHGSYLAVASTDIHSLVYASRYPTTWVLLKTGDCYLIQFADNNRVLDLHFGWGTNGNEIHIWPADANANKTWKLERLGDETGEELPEKFQEEGARLKRELDDKTESLSRKELESAVKEKELTRVVNELVNKERELSEQRAILLQHEDTIRQLREDLQAKDEALARAYRANEETAHLRGQQTHLQNELSQQQNETASLRAQMDRFEYLMSQMMSRDGSSTRVHNRT